MHEIEAVLLTGGASSRMGEDKASILIEGVSMGQRIADLLVDKGVPVTNIGGKPLERCIFLEDRTPLGGPLRALGAFTPSGPLVLLCSCDLPLLDVRIVGLLRRNIHQSDAAVPIVDGRSQPLCALYRGSALERIAEVLNSGKSSMKAWLDVLKISQITDTDLLEAGIRPQSVLGVNTPAELKRALTGDQT